MSRHNSYLINNKRQRAPRKPKPKMKNKRYATSKRINNNPISKTVDELMPNRLKCIGACFIASLLILVILVGTSNVTYQLTGNSLISLIFSFGLILFIQRRVVMVPIILFIYQMLDK